MVTLLIKLTGVVLGFAWFGGWFIVPLLLIGTRITNGKKLV